MRERERERETEVERLMRCALGVPYGLFCGRAGDRIWEEGDSNLNFRFRLVFAKDVLIIPFSVSIVSRPVEKLTKYRVPRNNGPSLGCWKPRPPAAFDVGGPGASSRNLGPILFADLCRRKPPKATSCIDRRRVRVCGLWNLCHIKRFFSKPLYLSNNSASGQ